MTIIQKQIHLLLSSDDSQGAVHKNDLGSSFFVDLETQNIEIPKDALDCVMYIEDGEYVFSFPNVIVNENDRIFISYNDGVNLQYDMDIQIPAGLYSIHDLDDTLQILQYNYPNFPEATPLVELVGNSATQRVLFRYNYDGIRIDLSQSASIRNLIGFDSGLYPILGPSISNTFDTAQSTANFNNVKFVLFSCTLCDKGFCHNLKYDYYCGRSLVTVGVGEQQQYLPKHKKKLEANSLIGNTLPRVHVKMLNDKGELLDTNGENFSISVVIEYSIKID